MRWIPRKTRHADVYVLANSRAAPLVDAFATATEQAIIYDLAWLDESFAGPRLRVFIVGTRARLKPLIDTTYGGLPIFDEHAVFVVGSDSEAPALGHEIMHLFSWQFWGTPATAWLSEGVATLMMPNCGGAIANTMTAELRRESKWIPLETLWHSFVSKDEQGVKNYVEGASLVDYIDKRWGRAKLRAFWPIGAYKNTQQRRGVDVATLERDWRASLDSIQPQRTWTEFFAGMQQRGCEG